MIDCCLILWNLRSLDISHAHISLTSKWKGTHQEILDFVETNFGAKDKFTWFEKGQVNGKNTREVYSFLKENLASEDGTKDIR